jgi:hypothetical protein
MVHSRACSLLAILAATLALAPEAVFAQGQDSTPGDRDLMVMAELLPGRYDNWNQNYFDGRRKLPESTRHERLHTHVVRVAGEQWGGTAFYAEDYRDNDPEKVVRRRVWSLTADAAAGAVRMRPYWIDDAMAAPFANALTRPEVFAEASPERLRYVPGCDVFFARELGQYAGASRAADCRFKSAGLGEVFAEYRYLLAPNGMSIHEAQRDRRGKLIAGHPSGIGYELRRAREFKCNADIPGVGGGAAIPFERYADLALHDKGGTVWFKTKDAEPREFQLSLSSVIWPINNETGAFTRNSLVLYVNERVNGEIKNLAYSGTDPKVERLFVNLKWMLVNCYMQFNRDVRPEF